jgi:peptidoglycan-associated lipoprotein
MVKPGSQEDLVVNVGDRVFFDFDKFSVRPGERKILKKQAAWLKTYPKVFVTIQGHADERGTREYNLALGDRRANSVKDYLVSLGVNPGRVNTISYGKERPVATGSSESAWSQNRRGVTKVTKAGS